MNLKIGKAFSNPLTISLIILIVLALYIQSSLKPIQAKTSDVAENIFSAERAQAMLEKVLSERKPHSVDSPQNRVVEKNIIQILKGMGYIAKIQQATSCEDYSVGVSRCTQVRNIVVKIKGQDEIQGELDSTPSAILLSAHYDSVDAGYGANDAGMAVATLLEVARILSLEQAPKNTIILLFNEGEEFGLFGAKAFMRQHPLAKTIKLALNVEARGTQGKSVMFETGKNSGWLVNAYLSSTPSALSSSLFYEVYKVLPNDTDLTVYKEHGLQGLNFAHGGREHHYHTPLDSFEHFPLGTLQHHGDNIWGVLNKIRNQSLNLVAKNNLVYTDIVGLFSIQWQQTSSLYCSFLLLLLVVFSWWRLSRAEKLHLSSIFIGLGLGLLLIFILPLTAWLLQNLTQFISGGVSPWRSNNLPMQLMLWSGLTLISLVIFPKRLSKACPLSLSFAIFLIMVLLAILTSLYVVGISFLFLIPASIMALIFTTLSVLNWSPTDKGLSVFLLIFCLVLGVVFLPIVYVLELMVGYHMSLAIGLMLSFVIMGLLALVSLCRRNCWTIRWHQRGLLGIFIVALFWTSFQAPYTREVPQSFNLTLLQDDLGDQFILGGTKTNPIPQSLKPLMLQAEFMQAYPWSKRKYLSQKIALSDLPLSEVELTSDRLIDEARQMDYKIHSSTKGFREIYLYIPQSSGLQRIIYKGQTLKYANEKSYRNGFYQFHCRGQTCASANIHLEFNNLNKQLIYLVNVYAGLSASTQKFTKMRGPKAVQRQFGDRRMMIKKVQIKTYIPEA
ncbi:MAG: M28 family peptidase [Enterobacterales bacterium]|nr:M28 family peptidase [Enterobacterales bacterium]